MQWTLQSAPGRTGRIAIVTGANAGIGFETALALVGKGCSVVLDLLINNAGIMMPPFSLSKDGFESQLAANYLGRVADTLRSVGRRYSRWRLLWPRPHVGNAGRPGQGGVQSPIPQCCRRGTSLGNIRKADRRALSGCVSDRAAGSRCGHPVGWACVATLLVLHHVQHGQRACPMAPGMSDVGQDVGDLCIVEQVSKRRHAVRTRVARGGRQVPSV